MFKSNSSSLNCQAHVQYRFCINKEHQTPPMQIFAWTKSANRQELDLQGFTGRDAVIAASVYSSSRRLILVIAGAAADYAGSQIIHQRGCDGAAVPWGRCVCAKGAGLLPHSWSPPCQAWRVHSSCLLEWPPRPLSGPFLLLTQLMPLPPSLQSTLFVPF